MEVLKKSELWPKDLEEKTTKMSSSLQAIARESGAEGFVSPEILHVIVGLNKNKEFKKEIKKEGVEVIGDKFIKNSEDNLKKLIKGLEDRKGNKKYQDKEGQKDIREYLGSDKIREYLGEVLGVEIKEQPNKNLGINVNDFLVILEQSKKDLKGFKESYNIFSKNINKPENKEAKKSLYAGALALITGEEKSIEETSEKEITRQRLRSETILREEESSREKVTLKKEDYARKVGKGLFGKDGKKLIKGIFAITEGDVAKGIMNVLTGAPLKLVYNINEYAKLSGYELLDFKKLAELGDEEKRNQFIKDLLLMCADLFENPALKKEFSSKQGAKNVVLILSNVINLVEKLEKEKLEKLTPEEKAKKETNFTPIKDAISMLEMEGVLDMVNEAGILPILLKVIANDFSNVTKYLKENVKNKEEFKKDPLSILIPLIREYTTSKGEEDLKAKKGLSEEDLKAILGVIEKRSDVVGKSVAAFVTNIPTVKESGTGKKYHKEIGAMSSKVVSKVIGNLKEQDLYGGVNFLLDIYEMFVDRGMFDKEVFEEIISDEKNNKTFTGIIRSMGDGVRDFSSKEKDAVIGIVRSFIPPKYIKGTLAPATRGFIVDLGNTLFDGVVDSLTDKTMTDNKQEFMLQLFNVIQVAKNNAEAEENKKKKQNKEKEEKEEAKEKKKTGIFQIIDLAVEVRKLLSIGIVDTFGGPIAEALAKVFKKQNEQKKESERMPAILKDLFEKRVMPNVKGAHRIRIDYEAISKIIEDPKHLKNLMQATEELSRGEPGKAFKTIISDMSLIGQALRMAFCYIIALLYDFFIGTFKNFMAKAETQSLGEIVVEHAKDIVPGAKLVEAITKGKNPMEYCAPLLEFLKDGLPKIIGAAGGKAVIEIETLNISPESFAPLLKDLNAKGIELKVDNLVIQDIEKGVNMQQVKQEVLVAGKVNCNQEILDKFEQIVKAAGTGRER